MGQRIGVALIGLGTVGSGVVQILEDAVGRDMRLQSVDLVGVAVRDLSKPRTVAIGSDRLTEDALTLIENPEVSIVIEVMGGVEKPYALIRRALELGKHVVTANKALLARHGQELFALAKANRVQIRYEAAVCGGIPVLQPLQQCFGANRVTSAIGIVNGTTNYILTQMADRSLAYTEALAEAQSLGYAEADPRADVDGNDAQEKIAILSSIAFRLPLPELDQIYREGISAIALGDVRYAQQLGFAIKLLAFAVRQSDGRIDLRVHPTLVPLEHPLSRVDGAFNAVVIEADPVGQIMFYGPGAGGGPTASAVVSDVINICAELAYPVQSAVAEAIDFPGYLPIGEVRTRFYIRLKAFDLPGVIGHFGRIFGDHGVSLESIVQKNPHGEAAELVIITHNVQESQMRSALDEIREGTYLKEFCTAIRVLPEG
ncbi:MAG: homoserine dehydrogenase [Anaerolineae bacterium]|nr:homoserine dehydrogenase [Gloeobacterales cyanobacterium ES-bin-313]